MSGYSAGLTRIDGSIIKECAKELQIPVDAAALPLKGKVPVDYHPPAQQPKANKYIEKPEIPAKASFLNVVGFIVIFILFIGFTISFLSNSLFEQSPNTAKLEKETAIEKSLTEEGKEQPTGIADSERDTKEMPLNMPQFENIKGVNDTEKMEVDQKQPDKDLKEIKTDTIAIDEASSGQLPEKESTEDKQSKIDEEITPAVQATNQSTKPKGEQLPLVLLEKKFSVFFRRDSTEIVSKDFETLAKIAEYLTRDTNSKVIVEGYTDSYGNNFYNQKLSQLRANMVKSYFVGQGIAISRISAIGLGSENPIGDNENRKGRSKNRRVEIRFELAIKGDVVN
jgi:outer membrane protein OmpA-like peptidoglycan-associated protein